MSDVIEISKSEALHIQRLWINMQVAQAEFNTAAAALAKSYEVDLTQYNFDLTEGVLRKQNG